MSDIPRVPQVLPSSLVNQQVHRVDHAGGRQPRKEHEKPQEDILDLHSIEEEPGSLEAGQGDFEGEGPLDIAV